VDADDDAEMGMDQEREDAPEDVTASAPAPGRRITRRRVLGYGAAGLAGLAGAAVAGKAILDEMAKPRSGGLAKDALADTTGGLLGGGAEDSAEVFKGDAPTGEAWQRWVKRGWAREARHFRVIGRKIQCRLCPNNCLLAAGDRGHCRNRVHVDGKLYTMTYGNPCTFHVDPVEKKPLMHFLPATAVFSLATSGCPYRCLNCQNWEISQKTPEETKDATGPELLATPARLREDLTSGDMRRLSMFPEHVVALAAEGKCPSIAYTYAEPISFYEYMADTAKLARAKGIKNIWITCGSIHRKPLEELCPYLDAANVNLKSFSQDIYRTLNTGKLQPILDTLKTLKENKVWFEVTNLVVPTYTDKMDMIRRMCDWLVANIGPDYPLHFSRFFPLHKLTHLPVTSPDVLIEARGIARKAGLRYVYIGNVEGIDGGSATYCPNCKRAVVDRRGFRVVTMDVQEGKCRFCKTAIAGVWSA
jgi:pyruvate formate lyase activating enzyme